MKQRIITGLLIIASIAPILVYGGIFLKGLIAVIGIFGVYETLTMKVKKTNYLIYFISLLFILTFILLDQKYHFSITTIYLMTLGTYGVISDRYQIDELLVTFAMQFILVLSMLTVLNIYKESNYLVLVYIIIANYASDTGAYFTGYFFGKHKLNERVSPKKTIEGSIGGLFIGGISSLIFGYYNIIEYLPLQYMIVISFSLPILGQIGDLFFSLIKRKYDLKDFGNIFPGHGGMLDRIDSLLFCLCIYNVVMVVI